MTGRVRGIALCAALFATVLVTLCAAAGHAGAAPVAAWQVSQGTDPTVLPPGSIARGNGEQGSFKYHLLISNVGGASVPSAVIATKLSNGVSPSATQFATFRAERGPILACTTAGPTVTCEVNEVLRAGAQIDVWIPVDVSVGAQSPALSEVTVTGPGSKSGRNVLESEIGSQAPPFAVVPGIYGLSMSPFDEEGLTPPAGAHPFVVEMQAHFPTFEHGPEAIQVPRPVDPLRNIAFDLPKGMVADPMATAERCGYAELSGTTEDPPNGCSPEAQVGVVRYSIIGEEGLVSPLFNMTPSPGTPAELGFTIQKSIVTIRGGLSGKFHLTASSSEILSRFPITGVKVDLWGVPSDPRHDYLRLGEGYAAGGCGLEECSIEPSPAPFLTMPTSCAQAVDAGVSATGWLGGAASGVAPLSERAGDPLTISDCASLVFAPSISSKATTSAGESASGLSFRIHQPQNEDLHGRTTAALRDAVVTLPEEMTVNPSAGNGLESCTEEQMGYQPEDGEIRFRTTPQTCPSAAKVGTMEVSTPLLEKKLSGGVFVAKPFANPFGSLLAIYLAIEDEETGIVAKLAGKVEPDASTGQLTAKFTENPELPIEDIELHLFDGPGASLKTPMTCGTKTTNSTLTPWSSPEGADAHPSDAFDTSDSCSPTEGAAPKAFGFTAGTQTPLAGSYSPFVLRISRPDGSQHIVGIDTTLPEGLLGKLAGVQYCPESAIAQAVNREVPEQGKVEQASSSCPRDSEVGSVRVTAGAGPAPIPVSGHAYLAGPYKGAPLSMVVIVPAVAGPFDLGTVVDRVALNVGEYDARIHAVADPLPTIRAGIPVDVRSIELKLDRPSFTLNPTSCEAMAIEGSASTQAGQSAALKNRFQVGECERLAFRPKLKISLKGQTKRTGHPALKAVVTYPKKGAYANIARAQVNLPHSEFLDQGNIGKACTKVLLAQRACPAKSIYGKVKAWTPLLDRPLEGPVYLVGGYGYKLPALVAELNGQIRVLLVGKVDTGKNKGIRNTFEAVPDAPVERFVLEMKGGKKYGLLENSENICRKPQKAGVAFRAQNGRVKQESVRIQNSCTKKAAKSHKHHKRTRGKHHR